MKLASVTILIEVWCLAGCEGPVIDYVDPPRLHFATCSGEQRIVNDVNVGGQTDCAHDFGVISEPTEFLFAITNVSALHAELVTTVAFDDDSGGTIQFTDQPPDAVLAGRVVTWSIWALPRGAGPMASTLTVEETAYPAADHFPNVFEIAFTAVAEEPAP